VILLYNLTGNFSRRREKCFVINADMKYLKDLIAAKTAIVLQKNAGEFKQEWFSGLLFFL
jgi:hypothetical protein